MTSEENKIALWNRWWSCKLTEKRKDFC
jgi:hypothetical protein